MIDTHAHIYSDKFKTDIDKILSEAFNNKIKHILMPNIDHTSIDGMLELEEKYPQQCLSMMGLHPCHVNAEFEKELYIVEEWLNKRKFIAVGEMGMDLYWDKTFKEQQIEAFKIQADFAVKHQLPLVIHARDAMTETISLLEEIKTDGLFGVLHCFTGTLEEAKQLIDLGFHLGIGGVATFKNGGLDKVIPHVDIKHLVLETDSPYLAPKPFRGKRNQPEYTNYVCDKVADFYGISGSEVEEITDKNAYKLFSIEEYLSK
ncbi:YchF/TatD family DNA exonuclease [Flammeovirga yaeyamensis]|uniref:YchF/TatD family DNA exonuclease n=1 Tax=Flammeovirga yaeyamensis TaxID=367791 RepID=A0AAX1N683_9BACT|nr:TatD family hydrolase [Flammeovirga yaeyamensis]MBB3697687.1 TatD DNase family protein [Flammeovirga yaeyamensis]NMF35953.1 TatD family hydrolase [Flammeovirga yaeyamensis]QWG03099.1 YchF/TatD family DNA exonuclease [Flammeovirga yaeyamensis]